MGIKSALTSTTGPLRKSVELSLTDFGYAYSVNQRGDAILSTICTAGPQPWLADISLFEQSAVVGVTVVLSEIFNPAIAPNELQELVSRLNMAVIFGAYLIPHGRNCVIYRTAKDFSDSPTLAEITAFFGQLNFPLSLWRELCSKWPAKTTIQSRLDASLIRLGAHDSGTISRRTRKTLLRLIKPDDAPDKFEAKPSKFSLMLI